MPPAKGSRKRTDYTLLKPRYMKHEWATLQHMAEALKLPYDNVRAQCKGWKTEREAIDAEAWPQERELIIEDLAQMRVKIDRENLALAAQLKAKAMRHLLAKFKSKTGKMMEVPFTSDAVAATVARLAMSVEASILKPREGLQPAGGGGSGRILDLGTLPTEPESLKENLRLSDPTSLAAMLKELDGQAGNKAGHPAGAEGKSGGASKRR